jgi:hypothetical protein
MQQETIHALKEVLIREFYLLYDEYAEHEIYSCVLLFTPHFLVQDVAISTYRSLFTEYEEDPVQYLMRQDKWQVSKWRYRASVHPHNSMTAINNILSEYFQQLQVFGNPALLDNQYAGNNLELMLHAFLEAKNQLRDDYGLAVDQILFFVEVPDQPEMSLKSAERLNRPTALLADFRRHHHLSSSTHHKLSRTDKDLLTDLAQMLEVDPYDPLQIAQEAYLLTLQPSFTDSNIYVQHLIQNIAAMHIEGDQPQYLEKPEILARIQQFY